MARYVNIDRIHYHEKENIDGYVYSEYVYKNEIEDLAIENVQPAISTRLILTNRYRDINGDIYENYKCGNCGKIFSSYDGGEEFNFCSHCGSKIIK